LDFDVDFAVAVKALDFDVDFAVAVKAFDLAFNCFSFLIPSPASGRGNQNLKSYPPNPATESTSWPLPSTWPDTPRPDARRCTEPPGACVLFNMHPKRARQLMRRIANQREFGLADRRRGLMPDLVREMGIGGNDIHLGPGLLELAIMLSGIFNLRRAVESERGGHENQHRPLALEIGIGDFDELAVMKRIGGTSDGSS